MTAVPLYLRSALALGATDIGYFSRADGSSDGFGTITSLAGVIDGINGGLYAPLVHTHVAADITDLTDADLVAGAGIAITEGVDSVTIAASGITEALITLADNTTNNVSITKHGLAPKAPNDSTKFLNGLGAWAVPSAGGVSDGDKGDITVSGSGTAWAIDNDVVTYAKIQKVSATSRVLGRKTAGSGDIEELTLSETLDFVGSAAQGDLLYRGASTWTRLGAGTSGQLLQTNGAGSNPSWVAPVGAITAPQGRLTLTSNTPVMTADATAQSSVYYAPYVGKYYPWYSGSAWSMRAFSQLTMSLDTTNQTSGSVYDLFVWADSGTDKIGAGPAWSSTTSRGTGAGTTELELKDGIWTNKVSITLKNGAGSGVSGVAANTATYVGTIYCTANGQTGMAFQPAGASGGSANILGVSNGYNRVAIVARELDSATSWTYATTTWRSANNNSNNRVTFVDGLQQSTIKGRFQGFLGGTSANPSIGMNLDSTSAAPNSAPQISGTTFTELVAIDSWLPQLGVHYIQAMEVAASANTYTFFGTSTAPTRVHYRLEVELMM